MINLNIPLDEVRSLPLSFIFDLIDNLTGKTVEEKVKTRVTAKDVAEQKEVEYKVWQI